MYINERNPIARRSLEAAKRFDKKLTLVPVIFLCLRSWGMMRFAIYSSSSVHESKPVRNAQEVLIYFQVSVPTVCSCYTREWSGEEYAWNNRERNRERDRTHRLLGIWRNLQTQFFALKSFKIQLRHSQSYLLDLKSIYLLSAWSRNAPIFRIAWRPRIIVGVQMIHNRPEITRWPKNRNVVTSMILVVTRGYFLS